MNPMAEKQLEITERDEAGNVTATYIRSPGSQEGGSSRLDIIVSRTRFIRMHILNCSSAAGGDEITMAKVA